MKVSAYITRSLRLMGVVQPTAQANGDQINSVLDTVIDFIGWLGTQNLTIFANVPQTFPLTALKQIYTFGLAAGADFAGVSPEWIDAAGLLVPVAGGQPYEMPLEIFSDTQWSGVPIKTLQSQYPSGLWYQRVGTSETTAVNSKINLWPVPTGAGLSLVLYTPDSMTDAVTANTDLAVRLGWRMMFRFNLAKVLLAEFAAVDPKVAALIVQMADDTLGDIKRVNQRSDYPEMDLTSGLEPRRGGYDWRMGVSR